MPVHFFPVSLRRSLPSILLAALLAPAAHAGGELEVRWWAPDLSSTVGADGADFDIDLELPSSLDLGLEADEDFEARLLLRSSWGLFIRGAYQNINSAGNTVIDLGVVGLPFDITAGLDGELDFEYGRLAIGWLFGPEDGPITGGVFAEAKGVRGDVAISASALGFSTGLTDDFEAAVPAAGAMLKAKLHPRVEIFGEASVAVDTDEADVTDYEVGARFLIGDRFAVGAGYRALEIDGTFDDEQIVVDYELDGAFVTAALRW